MSFPIFLPTSEHSLTLNTPQNKSVLTYIYNPIKLILAYSIALCSATMAVALSIGSLHRTKVATRDMFSQILLATRNPEVDKLVEETRWDKEGEKEFQRQRIRLEDLDGTEAFGGGEENGGRGRARAVFTLSG